MQIHSTILNTLEWSHFGQMQGEKNKALDVLLYEKT